MRSVHIVSAVLCLALVPLFGACVVPLASGDQNCASYCALLQGCGVAGAPTGDCNTWCSAFAEQLEHVGCKTDFDDAASCIVADGTCQAASCTAQTQAYVDCTTQFCAKNPMDSACPGS